jgi:hypothetical protein
MSLCRQGYDDSSSSGGGGGCGSGGSGGNNKDNGCSDVGGGCGDADSGGKGKGTPVMAAMTMGVKAVERVGAATTKARVMAAAMAARAMAFHEIEFLPHRRDNQPAC